MVKVRCLDSWQSQLTECKEYEVLATHNQYVCVEDDMGRVVWEYKGLFTACSEEVTNDNYKFKINWNIL